jgi:ferredoxin
MPLSVAVDPDRCTCEMNCIQLVPTVFEIGDDGVAHVLLESVPDELGRRVTLAVSSCPVQAITMNG